jgi:hypothetical protein
VTVHINPHKLKVNKGVKMARRKKDSVADVVVVASALLPWWLGVALTLACYLWLHSVALKPMGTLTQADSTVLPADNAPGKN